VRAKLASEASRWKWSSHRDYLGQEKSDLIDMGFPLSLFHRQAGASRRLYARFVNDGIAMGHKEDLYPSPSMPCLGEQSFVDDYQERVTEKTSTEAEKVRLIPLERLAAGLRWKMPLELLRSPTQVRKITAARREFVINAVKMGHRPSITAAFLRCSPSAISKIIARSL
jgi:hypothetical protein